MRTIDEQLRFAITNKRLVKLNYSGSVRVVEPHDYGVQKGAVRLLAYQQQSFGPKRSEQGWRLFDVAKIEELIVLDTVFKGSRGAHRTRPTMFGTSSTRVWGEQESHEYSRGSRHGTHGYLGFVNS